ncbi:RpiB/LacA/LacB family sugar-phosphate isomerase, partial [Mesorhizobium sp. M7A.F.Ca.CA.004.12.1.1]
MKIALGADSAGKPLLDVIAKHLATKPELQVVDLSQAGFYADIAASVGHEILDGNYDRAILFCGTGIGVSISANKVPGIRAALTHDTYSAERAA